MQGTANIMSGYYITASGKHIHPENITTDDICLDDIAHHLTQIQRFGGSLPLGVRYSVAQHSILMAEYAYKNCGMCAARLALFHDASEAYLGDVITYLKKLLPEYQTVEYRLMHTIKDKYNLGESWHIVEHLDKCILLDEAAAFFPNYYQDYRNQIPSYYYQLGVHPQNETDPHQVKQLFLYWCKKLGIED